MASDTPLSDALRKMQTDLGPRVKVMLDELAAEAEGLVRAGVAQGGSHSKGTPTPASPGRGPARVTGQLAAAVVARRARKTSTMSWRAEIGIADTPRQGSQYTNALVARFVEGGHAKAHRGTGRLSKKNRGSGGSVPPYPFLAPALKAVAAHAESALTKHLTRWP